MTTDVAGSNIPLLLSKSAMKSEGIKLDLQNNTAKIWRKQVLLDCAILGRCCLPLNNTNTHQDFFKLAENKRFVHSSKLKLKALLFVAHFLDSQNDKIHESIYPSSIGCWSFTCKRF